MVSPSQLFGVAVPFQLPILQTAHVLSMKVIDMVFSAKGNIDGEVSMLDDEVAYKSMSKAVNPYGDGQAYLIPNRVDGIECLL